MATSRKKPAQQSTTIHEAPLMVVGASTEAIKAARETILGILSIPFVDNDTKQAALQALNTLCAVNNTSISGCSLNRPTHSSDE